MNVLITKLKLQIIEQLNLEDFQPEDIDAKEPLFSGELGLDSIDALELIVLLEREYGLKIENQEKGREVFYSIESIAQFIKEHQPNHQ